MKVLSFVLASGVFALGAATAQADPAPTPAQSGAQTMPSGAEPESPPPATYDPGTPGVAPGTPTSGAAASRAAAAPDTATAPEAPSTTTTTTPSGESSTTTTAPSGSSTTTTTTTPSGESSTTTTTPSGANGTATPSESSDMNAPTEPSTGYTEPKTPNAGSTNMDVLPPPPNGQTVEAVPVAPLPPVQGAPEGSYSGYHAASKVGVGLLIGGGFEDFTNNRLQNVTGDGGYWTARIIAGTRQYIGMEAAYVGDARSISGLGLGSDSRLVSNGLEGNLRLNIPIMRGPSLLEPFGFVGVGWSHYTVSQNNTAVSDFSANDDVLTLPYGGGLEFAYRGFMADARFTYKQTYYNNLTQTIGGNLNNWGVGGQIGFEY